MTDKEKLSGVGPDRGGSLKTSPGRIPSRASVRGCRPGPIRQGSGLASSASAATTVVIMTESGTAEDPLAGWDPRRRAALERIRRQFKEAGGDKVSLVDELIAERRREAAAEDRIGLTDDAVIEHRPEPGPADE
jgi:hypothetical protein